MRLLSQTYGEEETLKWGASILERVQQAEVLRQRMHEESIPREAEDRHKLDDGSLPRPELVAEWLLRDMWEQQECGCSSQGWESTEQQFGQPTTAMPELPHKGASSPKEMFDMWGEGKGLWILRKALSEVQEIRKSNDGKWKGGDGMMETIVRRLTPL